MKPALKTTLLALASVLTLGAVLVRTASAQSNGPSAQPTAASSAQIAPQVTGPSALSAQTPDTDTEQADDQSGPDTPDATEQPGTEIPDAAEAQSGADTDTEQADGK